ncbi:rRNA maturation RNase YbeY [Hyphomicrobium sp.]|uniref:rRNA maturation RNase YbeY n=1 Tax=Hyphomicrobium sp. TaxID=82 RepID=UPI002C1BA388|nr:rRNA maturation RNase YbeY [Hyphomicrobium sp.]HRN88205.1 rRNA maturation RNase YbeY [Hyphomicrobium sp.]HRQ27987.1 rRNA maturation RNase YbeY [Hyphomicrobium sp.]
MPDEPDSRRSPTGRAVGAPLWLTVDIVHEAESWSSIDGLEELIEEAARALTAVPRFSDLSPAEACIALADDASVRELNLRYRGKDKPTNVLSFPAAPMGHPAQDVEPRALGDLVLAHETLVREAGEQSIPLAHHLQHLVVHGLLHLLGFDHETEPEAEEMEAIEVEILACLGIPNPYQDETNPIAS